MSLMTVDEMVIFEIAPRPVLLAIRSPFCTRKHHISMSLQQIHLLMGAAQAKNRAPD
jgi:hypothetical protein